LSIAPGRDDSVADGRNIPLNRLCEALHGIDARTLGVTDPAFELVGSTSAEHPSESHRESPHPNEIWRRLLEDFDYRELARG
jgi:hypothetical protein